MLSVEARLIPDQGLLTKYRDGSPADGVTAYTDCYATELPRPVTLQEFVYAFYTTPVFRLERLILKYLAGKPSTDKQVELLADGSADSFAAWRVEQRTGDQLLLCDFAGRTRSWFMITPIADGGIATTTLMFGSAVVPSRTKRSGELELGRAFTLLLGFHRLYSRILLRSARSRLQRPRAGSTSR